MALPNAYAKYNNSKILTASPAELTLMLYDGAIKFCNIAIMGIEQNDINKAHTNIRKVERIIEEFRSTLDRRFAVAEDFDRVYVYLLRRLLEANLKKDKEILELEGEEFLDAWLTWNGICGFTRDIIDAIYYAYGIDLELGPVITRVKRD